MTTTIKQENSAVVVYFDGRLDTAAAHQVQQDVKPLDDCKDQDIILDCTRLDYISSSGLRIFLSILKRAQPNGCHVAIRGLQDNLRQVFIMTGFINLFQYVENA